ncbi:MULTISPECIES: Nif3-like dinuclear metal center hexameric protein [Paraliobacillus]|nr:MULTISPECIES: Nif3-like dinuclear metal center hexameric protein [Paraliobacillus]
MVRIRDIVAILEELAPKEYAYDWDNVGLQIGSSEDKVNKVLLTLDVLENVVDEAIEKEVDLIIAHHPLLFKPLKQIDTGKSEGRIIEKLLKHKIAVYAVHTNLDVIDGGVSDILSDRLEVIDTSVLVPSEHGDSIGAGRIGELKETISLNDFCLRVKEKLEIPALRVVGELNKKVRKVAVLGGSGKDFINQAKLMGADVYVTGDMTFHDAQDAMAMDLAVIDPGHHVEKVMKAYLKSYLEKKTTEKSLNVTFEESIKNTEPFQFL